MSMKERLQGQKCETLSEKHNESKRTRGMVHVVEHSSQYPHLLSRRPEFNLQYCKKKKKSKQQFNSSFLAALRFELRALCVVHKHCTT
jgi:hypothetical protein